MNKDVVKQERDFSVVHVTTVHRLSDNRILRKECRAFADAGKSVTLVGPGQLVDREIPDEPGVTVRRTRPRASRLARVVLGSRDIWMVVRSVRPSVLHLHDPELVPMGILWKKRYPNTVVIYDAHEHLGGQVGGKSYIPKFVRPLLENIVDPILKISVRQFDGVIAATDIVSEIVSHPRSITIQNYPWLRSFSSFHPSSASDLLVLGYVGGLNDVRGLDVMLALADRMADSCLLRLAGPATPEAIRTMNGHPNVEYVGVLDPKEVPEFVSGCDVGLVILKPLRNYVDAQPTKLFEYMAVGIPFVASNFRRWEEIVGDTECGIFVDPFNLSAVEDAILKLQSAELRARLGKNGRALVYLEMGFETEAKKLVEFAESLVYGA